MSYSTYAKTRSARLTVTTPSGQKIVVSNLDGNDGFYMTFEGRRSMDNSPAEFTVSVYNMDPEALAVLNAAQTQQVDDWDKLLVDVLGQLDPQTVAADGSDALKAGFCIIELEAGYDQQPSRVFQAIGARITTVPDSSLTTYVTTFVANENLDGQLLGFPLQTFPAGSATYDLVDALRRGAGLGPGNFNPGTWFALCGLSQLESPFHFSGGQALDFLDATLKWMPMRWFVDDRQLWICGREGWTQPGGPPPWVTDGIETPEILTAPPHRDDAGRVVVECLLSPKIKPGRLVLLTPAGLALANLGLSPTIQQIQQAQVPPGLYRADEVAHSGDTGSGDWTTRILLRPTKGV